MSKFFKFADPGLVAISDTDNEFDKPRKKRKYTKRKKTAADSDNDESALRLLYYQVGEDEFTKDVTGKDDDELLEEVKETFNLQSPTKIYIWRPIKIFKQAPIEIVDL